MAIEQKHQTYSAPSGAPVGSDPAALHNQGGKGDFGVSVRPDIVRETEGEIVGRPAGSAPGYSGAKGVRTTGVGSTTGEPGHASGGDLDTSFNGFGATGAIAAKPIDPAELSGADVVDGTVDKFASGGPAAGRNTIKPGTHGAAPSFTGDTVDHTGTARSAVSPDAAGSVKAAHGNLPGAEGEITMDEATGDLDQGAET